MLRICRVMLNLLLEQDGAETSVESTNTLILHDLAESANESIGVRGFGNETDTSSLKRAEGNIGEELCEGRRGQVDSCAVVGGGLVAEEIDGLLLEKFVSSELESALEEITSSGRTETSQ